jgi:hypothetical protein
MTQLRPLIHKRTGKVHRIYVKRSGLHATLWFEESRYHPGMCDVRFKGHEGDFGGSRTNGEAAYIAEARAALTDLGLDMATCTWNDIVERAKTPASRSQSLPRFIFRCFSLMRHRSV